MKTRAAVAFEKAKPLEITQVELDGPKAGEVLVEIKATGICPPTSSRSPAPIPKGCSPPSSAMRAPASSPTSGRA